MLETLLNTESQDYNGSWKALLFNVQAVKQVTQEIGADVSVAEQLCRAGQSWTGAGLATGTCSKLLYEVTGVTLVSANFADYRDAFLFSLTLWFGLEVLQLDLTEKAAEASFVLAQRYAEGNAPGVAGAPEREDEEAGAAYPWDEPEVDLPHDLKTLWDRAVTGTKRLDLRAVLEQVPRWSEIPQKPKQNNYRGDGHSKVDKLLKVAQQQVLHAARIQAAIYCLLNSEQPEDGQLDFAKQLQLQLFQYLGDAFHVLDNERKEHSLPGSTKTDEMLFGREEIQTVKLQGSVNSTRTFRFGMFSPRGFPLGQCRFRPSSFTGGKSKGWNFKTKGGYSGSFGTYKGFGRGRFNWGRGFGKKGIFSSKGAGSSFPFFPQVASKSTGQGGLKCRPEGKAQGQGDLKFSRTVQQPIILPTSDQSSFSVSETKHKLVDKSSSPSPHYSVDNKWNWRKLALPITSVHSSKKKFSARNVGIGSFTGLLGNQSSGGSKSKFQQIFGSLVCVGEKRFSGKKKVEVNHRLQNSKFFFGNKAFQIRPLEKYFSNPKKEHVGLQNRFAKCLFSFSTASKVKTIHAHTSRRKVFSVQCSLFWPKCVTSNLDGSH